MKRVLLVVVVLLALGALYFLAVLNWNFSAGERAGWVQKLSKKGWICKTWEGEMAMVTMPGAVPEKFLFTVWDDKVADDINRKIGKRVALHYEEKVGLPTTCFGETRHYVTAVTVVDDIPLVPGIIVPQGGAAPAAPAPSSPTPAAPPAPAAPSAPAPAPTAPAAPAAPGGSTAPEPLPQK
jgi:hypothetical protein